MPRGLLKLLSKPKGAQLNKLFLKELRITIVEGMTCLVINNASWQKKYGVKKTPPVITLIDDQELVESNFLLIQRPTKKSWRWIRKCRQFERLARTRQIHQGRWGKSSWNWKACRRANRRSCWNRWTRAWKIDFGWVLQEQGCRPDLPSTAQGSRQKAGHQRWLDQEGKAHLVENQGGLEKWGEKNPTRFKDHWPFKWNWCWRQ